MKSHWCSKTLLLWLKRKAQAGKLLSLSSCLEEETRERQEKQPCALNNASIKII